MPNPSEADTRKEFIDAALIRAGWDVDNPEQVGIEIPADGFDRALGTNSKRDSRKPALAGCRQIFAELLENIGNFKNNKKKQSARPATSLTPCSSGPFVGSCDSSVFDAISADT